MTSYHLMIFEKKIAKIFKKKFQKIFIASIPQYEYVLTFPKVLFTYEYTWQNFHLQLLHLVNNCESLFTRFTSFAMCIHR